MNKNKVLNSDNGIPNGVDCCWSTIYGLWCDCGKPKQRTKKEARLLAKFFKGLRANIILGH